jgi:hypothetical protein
MSIVHDCLSGNRPGDRPRNRQACIQVYFWAYLWPRIRSELELPPRIIPEPPGPDWDPYALDSNIAAAAVDPNPEPALRLEAMIKLRDNLAKMTAGLDADIKELQKK